MSSTVKITEFPDIGKDKFEELLYARKLMGRVKVRTRENEWFLYNRKAWEPCVASSIHPIALACLPESMRSSRNAEAIMRYTQMDRQIGQDERLHGAIRFDEEAAVLVNCQNGVLRVARGATPVLMPHDEELLFTGCLNASWDAAPAVLFSQVAPLFLQTLREVLPDQQDQILQQWFAGYLLFPSNKHEVFLISYGGGGTGKSTISDAVMEVIGGKPLRTVLSLAQICSEGQGSYSLPTLAYALVNMGTELDTVAIGDSANFKRLVSGEPIEVRPIYGSPFTMTQYTVKLWFNSNSLPRFHQGTDAELRRSRFLEFRRKPAAVDPDLKEKLKKERDGIFMWMVEGLQAIMDGMPAPEGGLESRRVKERFAVSNDPVRAFASECLIFGPEEEVLKDELWTSFSDFLGSWGFAYQSREKLFRQFYERYPDVKAHREKYGKVRAEGQWVLGVRLREKEDDGEDEGDSAAPVGE